MSDPKTFPVIEVFGPTIQGEGAEAGQACHFIRFGGCDFRCNWCDSMYAVDPAQVRANAEKLNADQILDRISDLDGQPDWVVISGGNPALLDLTYLVDELHALGFKVAVETQGSIWKPWLAKVDRLTVSPKPPSSGMATCEHGKQFVAFWDHLEEVGALPRTVCKIVVTDSADLDWATRLIEHFDFPTYYLSVCTPQHEYSKADLILNVAERYRWLCECTAADPRLAGVKVLPQLHVLAWGAQRGH